MEHRLKQKRRSSGSGNNKAWKWLQRENFEGEYAEDDEHVTAVAAAAFSIHSLEEAGLLNLKKMTDSQTMRGKSDNQPKRPSFGETSFGGDARTLKRSFGGDARTRESAFPVRGSSGISSPRHVPSESRHQNQMVQHNNDKAKAEAWEKAKIEKIHKRYEKIKSQILSWENENKNQVKLHMERKKKELEHRRAMAMQHYNNKIARIDMIAQGALAQLEDKRRKEVAQAREKANRIRKRGRVPIKCFCF